MSLQSLVTLCFVLLSGSYAQNVQMSFTTNSPVAGRFVEATCTVTNLQPSQTIGSITWRHNGNIIVNGGRFTITSPSSGRSDLTIENLVPSDAGDYVCFAELQNPVVQRTSSPATLVIQTLPTVTADPEQEALEGETAILRCNVTTMLDARITWYRGPEGSEVVLGLQMSTDSNFGMWIITNVQVNDAGRYRCEVDDAIGSASAIIQLVIQNVSSTITSRPPDVRMFGNSHYSILLPNGQLLCFTVHGQSGFSFNLISNKQMHMNALFVQDPKREEITWIGSLGVVVRGTRYKNSNITKLRFDASDKKIYVGDKVTLLAQKTESLTLSKGKLSIAEFTSKPKYPVVHVDLQDVGLSLTVRFKRFHLDIIWNKVDKQPKDTHGLIGQFFREGVEIDESRRLLLLGPDMEPVPVMRKPVWSFMERKTPEDQLCWAAMNPGYQGKRLIQGHYLDYLVDDVLSSDFKFGHATLSEEE